MSLKQALVFGVCCVAASGQGVVIGQLDDFQSGTLLNWTGGSAPTNIPSGGPQGASDRYLRISTDEAHLATHNDIQWAGNYLGSGVRLVEVQLKNFSPGPLHIRLVLNNSPSRWTSLSEFVILPDGEWHDAAFWVREADMVKVSGTQTFSQVATSLSHFMIRHDVDPPSSGGDNVIGTLGIDNVVASAGRIVSGTVQFTSNELTATPPAGTFEFRNVGSTIPLRQKHFVFDSSSNFMLMSPPTPGMYDLSIKPTHWLRRTILVDTSLGDVSGAAIVLINGDVEDDNEINIVDFGQLAAAFGADSGSPNWNPNADLDEDGEVTIVDSGILSSNFGAQGDE